MFTISWQEYTHKLKGCGADEFQNKMSERNLKHIAEHMLNERGNYLGCYQQVYCYLDTDEFMNGDMTEFEVPPEVIKQIIHWYIDSL